MLRNEDQDKRKQLSKSAEENTSLQNELQKTNYELTAQKICVEYAYFRSKNKNMYLTKVRNLLTRNKQLIVK